MIANQVLNFTTSFYTCSENVLGSEDLPSLWYKLLTTSPDIVCEYLKKYYLWISWKIGMSVSRGSNFILTAVPLKTLQDKLKLYHWNFERMMDESCIIALKGLIGKEEVFFFFLGGGGMNKAFRFMTLFERKERESVFWMLKSYHMVPFAGIIWHLTYGECHYFLSLRKVLKLSTLSPILNRSISKAVTGQFAMSSIPAPLLSKQIMA